jgi:hypothetical protein
MEEGKKILGIFLVVLFIIIVLGVVISRVRSQKKNVPIVGGSLESILFPDRPTPKPTTVIAEKSKTTSGSTTNSTTKTTSKTQSSGSNGSKTTSTSGQNSQKTTTTQNGQNQTNEGQAGQNPVVLGQSTTQSSGGTTAGSNNTGSNNTGSNGTTTSDPYMSSDMTKGGVSNAQNIPDTGTPTIFLSFALSALGSGVALRKYSGISLKKTS